ARRLRSRRCRGDRFDRRRVAWVAYDDDTYRNAAGWPTRIVVSSDGYPELGAPARLALHRSAGHRARYEVIAQVTVTVTKVCTGVGGTVGPGTPFAHTGLTTPIAVDEPPSAATPSG